MRNILIIISVLFPPVGIAFLADFLALIVPKFRWNKRDFEGFVALYCNVVWNPRIHSCFHISVPSPYFEQNRMSEKGNLLPLDHQSANRNISVSIESH